MGEKAFDRGAGILLSIASIPSEYGMGTLGNAACGFVDLLVDLKQKYWQIPQSNATDCMDDPYQQCSVFAGNPYLVDPGILMQEGLVTKEEVGSLDRHGKDGHPDYQSICEDRHKILEKAYERFDTKTKIFRDFCEDNKEWLDDYSLFMSLKTFSEDREWIHWEMGLRNRNMETMREYSIKMRRQTDFWKFCQFQFFSQWGRLKKYANARGIRLIGEIPFYVRADSADVWAHKEVFRLDKKNELHPLEGYHISEVSNGHKDDRLVYNWESMEKGNYAWWKKRIKKAAAMYDALCIDSFSDVVKYYAEPVENGVPKRGAWYKGPGKKLTDVMEQASGGCILFAGNREPTVPGVKKLAARMGWSGVRFLPEAFCSGTANENLPHNYTDTKVVVYAGARDNMSVAGFFRDKTEYELAFLYEYLGIASKEEIPDAIIRLAYSSVADVVIMRMRDILESDRDNGIGSHTTQEIFRWGTGEDGLTEERRSWLRTLASIYRR